EVRRASRPAPSRPSIIKGLMFPFCSDVIIPMGIEGRSRPQRPIGPCNRSIPMPFGKGQSGNPAWRPVGSRNKFTREMQDGLEEAGPLLVQRLLELAGEGNMGAMRQCLDRLMGKQRPSAVQLPALDSPNYVMEALTEIHRALGAGEIATDEASRLV